MSKISSAAKVWSTDGDTGSSADMPVPDAQDAAQFRQWVQDGAGDEVGAGHAPGAHPPLSVGEVLDSVSRTLHEKEAAFNRALERTGRTGDPVEGLIVQQRLSELYLEHGLTTKVIAKTTQAIETLMKLQ
jgi:hypothetical protein